MSVAGTFIQRACPSPVAVIQYARGLGGAAIQSAKRLDFVAVPSPQDSRKRAREEKTVVESVPKRARPAEMAPSFIDEVWTVVEPIFQDILNLPFIRGIADGTLDMDIFRRFVVLDLEYLEDYDVHYYHAAGHCQPDQTKPDLHNKTISLLLNRALALGQSERKTLKSYLEDQDIYGRPYMPEPFKEHIRHLKKLVQSDLGFPALFPCFWIYSMLGKKLLKKGCGSDTHPFHRWVKSNGSQECLDFVEQVKKLLNQRAADATAPNRGLQKETIRGLSLYEFAFFQNAYVDGIRMLLSERTIRLEKRGNGGIHELVDQLARVRGWELDTSWFFQSREAPNGYCMHFVDPISRKSLDAHFNVEFLSPAELLKRFPNEWVYDKTEVGPLYITEQDVANLVFKQDSLLFDKSCLTLSFDEVRERCCATVTLIDEARKKQKVTLVIRPSTEKEDQIQRDREYFGQITTNHSYGVAGLAYLPHYTLLSSSIESFPFQVQISEGYPDWYRDDIRGEIGKRTPKFEEDSTLG